MRASSRVLVLLLGGACACSLITSLDGLSDDAGSSDASDATTDAIGDAITDAQPPTTYHAIILGDLPKSYWRLGEARVDASLKDEINTNAGIYNDGVELGVPGAIANDPNTAAAFDGSSNAVALFGDIFDFAGDASCSFEAWVIATKPYTSTGYILERLVTGNKGWTISTGTSGQVAYSRLNPDAASNTVAITPLAQALSPTSYTHVVVVFDGTTIVMYLNGAVAWTMANATPNTAAAAVLGIGAGWEGSIDEVAVYAYPLNAARVARHYQAGIGVTDF